MTRPELDTKYRNTQSVRQQSDLTTTTILINAVSHANTTFRDEQVSGKGGVFTILGAELIDKCMHGREGWIKVSSSGLVYRVMCRRITRFVVVHHIRP